MQKINSRAGIAIIIGLTLLLVGTIFVFWSRIDYSGEEKTIFRKKLDEIKDSVSTSSAIEPFASEADFKAYLEENQSQRQYSSGLAQMETMSMPADKSFAGNSEAGSSQASNKMMNLSTEVAEPNRFSETNRQVLSIDEPDIVKTDGQNIYYSKERSFDFYRSDPIIMDERMSEKIGIVPPYPDRPRSIDETQIIKAFPIAEAKKIGRLENNGNLFLKDKTLVILAENKQKIYAYDVSNPEQPKEKWSWSFEEQNQIVASRMMNGKIFLVTNRYNDIESPCPIRPMVRNEESIELSCTEIYHPTEPIPADTTYSFIALDIETGKVTDKTAFVGSNYGSEVYMSENAIYLTYQKPTDEIKLFTAFLRDNPNIFKTNLAQKIKKLEDYDISSRAKNTELESLIETELRSLGKDELTKLRNEVNNQLAEFAKKEGKRHQMTGIVKIGNDNLEFKANGEVPGRPLNQFSLDEYKGNLRIAVTFEPLDYFPGGFYVNSRNEQASDVYILNENLNQVGAVEDMGKGERIYAVRFLQDRGFVVTFKQIDPFFVLDLSSPNNPKLKGELKIPGYSSYLHPLPNGQILGIGEENGQVKISSFDVSDPSNPKEVSTYRMEESWSEAGSNHHAFLLDEKQKVFFIPGGEGGYIFSYEGGIKLERAVGGFQVKRAVYIDDYMFVIGEEKIKIINEKTWSDEKEIEL